MEEYLTADTHPFDDGIGRGERLLMNIILSKTGYPFGAIRVQDKWLIMVICLSM